jgi:hypothetical protein
MCVDYSPIVRRRTYVSKVALEVLVLLSCLDRASPLDPVPVFAVTRAIHLMTSLAYWDTFFSNGCHRQILDIAFIGCIQRDEWTHIPQVTA